MRRTRVVRLAHQLKAGRSGWGAGGLFRRELVRCADHMTGETFLHRHLVR